ncbi:MAG TPA: hypothetical protein VGE67_10690, partial [Haloferula sp.]
MNPSYRLTSSQRRNPVFPLCSITTAALAILTSPALAIDVNLTATNTIDTTSFNTSLSWSNAAVPSAGNAYFVANNYNLRTPASGTTDLVFGGDSLTLTGGNLVYKGSTNVNTITINNLTLN